MAVQKTAFTSRDIETAFGMSNREQVYLVDRGHLVPDVQSDRPRLYSLYSAMKAGAVQFFMRHGYKLELADRLAEIVMLTVVMTNQDNVHLVETGEIKIYMDIKDGEYGVVYFKFEDTTRIDAIYFSIKEEGESIDSAFFENDFISVCVYNMKRLWSMLSGSLEAEWRSVCVFPEYVTEKVKFVVLNKTTGTKRLVFKTDRIR